MSMFSDISKATAQIDFVASDGTPSSLLIHFHDNAFHAHFNGLGPSSTIDVKFGTDAISVYCASTELANASKRLEKLVKSKQARDQLVRACAKLSLVVNPYSIDAAVREAVRSGCGVFEVLRGLDSEALFTRFVEASAIGGLAKLASPRQSKKPRSMDVYLIAVSDGLQLHGSPPIHRYPIGWGPKDTPPMARVQPPRHRSRHRKDK